MKPTLIFVLTLLVAPSLTGCSIMLRLAGQSADRRAREEISLRDVNRLHAGDKIAVKRDDDTTVEALFGGVEKTKVGQLDSSTARTYPVTFVVPDSGAMRSGHLVGIDADTLWVQLEGKREASPFSLGKIKDLVDVQKHGLDDDALQEVAPTLPLQFNRTLIVSPDSTTTRIPFERIKLLRPNDDLVELKWWAMGVGIDVGLIGIGLLAHNIFGHRGAVRVAPGGAVI